LLDFVADNIRTAGPLIIVGSFVFGCMAHIVPSDEELEKKGKIKEWNSDKTKKEVRYHNFVKSILHPFVILGVCFGLTYAWIGKSLMLIIALAFMSVVGLILFYSTMRTPLRRLSRMRLKLIITNEIEKNHPNN
jgi:hypothetical protein